jgi:putative membrane protein
MGKTLNHKFRFANGRFHYQGNQPPQVTFLSLLLAKWLILTVSVIAASYLIENIHVTGFFAALFAAAAIGFLNMFFRPVLLILTLPINIMSLGLFTFLINALMLKMASGLIPGFSVIGFWSTVFGAIVISVVNWFLNMIVADTTRPSRMRRPPGPGTGPGPTRPGPRRTGGPDDETIDLKKKGDHWE